MLHSRIAILQQCSGRHDIRWSAGWAAHSHCFSKRSLNMGMRQIEPPGDCRFQSLSPFTRVPFWGYPIFDPHTSKQEAVRDFGDKRSILCWERRGVHGGGGGMWMLRTGHHPTAHPGTGQRQQCRSPSVCYGSPSVFFRSPSVFYRSPSVFYGQDLFPLCSARDMGRGFV